MPLFARKPPRLPYDPEEEMPAVRKSICTGEMTAGFVNKKTGKFRELMLVDHRGLEDFRRATGVEEIRVIY